MAVVWLVGFAAWLGVRIHYVNFIALPITLGIGCEYPFNIADRARLLGGDAAAAVARSGGAVLLCSFTTMVGYASLLASDFQALQSFGTLAVFGEGASVFAAVFALPAAMARFGGGAWPGPGHSPRAAPLNPAIASAGASSSRATSRLRASDGLS
jgi:hypothetical protein